MKKIFFSFTLLLPLIWYLNLADQLIWITPNPDDYAGGVYLADKSPLPVELRLLTTGSIDPSRFTVYIDGIAQAGKLGNTTLSGATFRTKVELKDGRQVIEVAYTGSNGTVRSSKLTVEYHSDKPNLWLFAFGTKPLDLQYPADDARDIASLFRQQEGRMYGKVNIKTLLGPEASGYNMRGAIEEILTLSRLEEIHPQDVVMIFVSSHGFIDDSDLKLYLKGTDWKAMQPTSTSLPFELITQNLDKVNCKKLIFVDACHSGAGKGYQNVNDAMTKLLQQQNGVTAIASSGPDQLSHEDEVWQHGAFTEALIDGFNGAADTDADGFVTIDEIWNYVSQTVPPMVYKVKGQSQRPTLLKKGLQDIPVFSYKGVSPIPPPREADTDGDGITDNRDNCPSEYGTSLTNGCPDADNDGIPDKSDQCKYIKGESRWEGCPDTDGDGIPDHKDRCPKEKGSTADSGCPPADGDGDGVPDVSDRCKTQYGSRNFQGCPDTDNDGIPDPDDDCPDKAGSVAKNGCPEEDFLTTNNMILVPGGTFTMGSMDSEAGSNEKPTHSVTVSGFYMGKYEVTYAQFKAFIDDTGYKTDAENSDGSNVLKSDGTWEKRAGINWRHDAYGNTRSSSEYNHPVIHVSWTDATEYCKWLSKKTGRTFRLPTEAEWEYAAGNGSRHTKYSWGDGNPTSSKGGNVADMTAKNKYSRWTVFEGYTDGYVTTAPVGKFSSNDFGLFDMTGNVWEWCSDWYGDYSSGSTTNPTGPSSGSIRVIRGGGWINNPQNCRVALRYRDTPTYRNSNVGFRLVSPQ